MSQDHQVNIRYDMAAKAWSMQYPAMTGTWQQAPFPDINVGKVKNAKISFTIVESDPSVVFLKDKLAISDTVHFEDGSGKPLKGSNSGMLKDAKTTGQEKSLTIVDKNPDGPPFEIEYVLHFANGVADLDPIIKNGGGPIVGPGIDPSYLLLGGLVLALAAFFIGRKTMGRG